MKKRVVAMVMAAALVVGSAGAMATTVSADEEKTITIAYPCGSLSDVTSYITVEKVKNSLAETHPEVELLITDANGEIEQQVTDMQMFVDQGVDIIILGPFDYEALTPVVKEANEKGITVINFMSPISGGDTIYIGSESDPNVETRSTTGAGDLQAQYMADLLPENAKILYLSGTYGMIHTTNRMDGFMNNIKELRPDVEVLSEQTGDYVRDEGLRIMEDWINTFDDFDAVISANDQMALGAIDAMKAAGMEDRLKAANSGNENGDGIFVTGVDGSVIETMEAIRDGLMTMTSYQNVTKQTEELIKTIGLILESGDAEDVMVPYEVIDKNNVEEHIERLSVE